MRLIDLRPPRIALSLTVTASFSTLFDRMGPPLPCAPLWAGVVVMAAGFSLTLWSWRLFKIARIALCPGAETTRMMTRGPYRFTRNPMYLGMFLILLGTALCAGTLPFYLSAAVFFLIMHFRFCPYEEAKLAASFGKEYTDYSARVRRWI